MNEKGLKRLQSQNRMLSTAKLDKYPSFRVQVRRFVTNVDGTIIDKNTLPAFARVKYPVWLFNAYDAAGGYFAGIRNYPVGQGLFYLYNDTYGNTFNLLNFSGANNVKERLTIGDQFFIFSNSEQFPSFFVWIVLSVELRAYGSILNNPLDRGMNILSLQYNADNTLQFQEPIGIVKQNEIGNVNKDEFAPIQYKTPDYQQDTLVLIPFKNFRLNNYVGNYFYMLFDTDQIDMIYRYVNPQNDFANLN